MENEQLPLNDPPDQGQSFSQGWPVPGWDRAPVFTLVFLGANILIWLATDSLGAEEDPDVLVNVGAMFGPLIADGQYWRLFTAIFLHHDLVHLAFNGFGLFIFGRLVERVYGHWRFIVIFVITGLFGSVASYMANSIAIGAGASGAIFGVLGALVVYFATQNRALGKLGKQNLIAMMFIATIGLLHGWRTPGIDHLAHLGGFVAGLVLGLILGPRYRVKSTTGAVAALVDVNSLARTWWVVAPPSLVLLALGAWAGTINLPENPYSHLYQAERYYEVGDYDLALDEIDKATDPGQKVPVAHLMRGAAGAYLLQAKISMELGDWDAAKNQALIAISLARRAGSNKTKTEAEALQRQLRGQ